MPTRKQRAESVVSVTLERVARGQSNEDAFVELKLQFPTPNNDADEYEFVRQIAAHANAASGEDIYWLIGVHPQAGARGAEDNELANWRNRYERYFQAGVFPDVQHINVQAPNGNNIVVLMIETDRAPYVVRNPLFGKELFTKAQQRGGPPIEQKVKMPIEWEVPFRRLESAQSATRMDLNRILTPLERTPECELVACLLYEASRDIPGDRLPNGKIGPAYTVERKVECTLFIYAKKDARVFLPWHRTKLFVGMNGSVDRVQYKTVALYPQSPQPGGHPMSMLDGAGEVRIHAVLPARSTIYEMGAKTADVVVVVGALNSTEKRLVPIELHMQLQGPSTGAPTWIARV